MLIYAYMRLYTYKYAYIGVFGLYLVLTYVIAPPGEESHPQLQGRYAKLPNAITILARCYSIQCQHCILKCKAAWEVGESAKQQQKSQIIMQI